MSDLFGAGIQVSDDCKFKNVRLIENEMFKFKQVNFHGISFLCSVIYKHLVIDETMSDLSSCTMLIFKNEPQKGKNTGEWEDPVGDAFAYIAEVDLSECTKDELSKLTDHVFKI